MQKITIKELVDFRRKPTDQSKKKFAHKLKNRQVKEKSNDDDSPTGGDYWISSSSCIYNVLKYERRDFYEDKINELSIKLGTNDDKRVKSMYQRNIDILNGFKDFNTDDIKPPKILKFETVQRVHTTLYVNDFPLYVNPSLLFSYERHGKNELGAIWLVSKLHGFKKDELGMFCEILYAYMTKNYSDSYQISNTLCVAIDTFNAQKVTYPELTNGDVPFMIHKTLAEIEELK